MAQDASNIEASEGALSGRRELSVCAMGDGSPCIWRNDRLEWVGSEPGPRHEGSVAASYS